MGVRERWTEVCSQVLQSELLPTTVCCLSHSWAREAFVVRGGWMESGCAFWGLQMAQFLWCLSGVHCSKSVHSNRLKWLPATMQVLRFHHQA